MLLNIEKRFCKEIRVLDSRECPSNGTKFILRIELCCCLELRSIVYLETTYYSNDHFNPGLKGANIFMSFTYHAKTDPGHIDYINRIPICPCLTKLPFPIYELLLLN